MTNVSVMGRVLGAIVLLSAAQAAAQDPVAPGRADCSTPRRAVWTWLANFQEDGMHPEQGVRCFDWEAVDIDDLDTRTQRGLWLKRVVDDRGLLFDPSAIPDSEALEEGEDRYAPFPNNLPQLYLVKSGSSWLFSAETIRAIPGLHDQLFDVEGYLDEAPPWLRDRILGVAIWKLLGLAVVLILALVLRQTITWLAQSQGARLVATLVKESDRTLLQRAAQPVGTVAATIFLIYAVPALRLGVGFNRIAVFGLRVAAAVSAVLIAYRLVDVGADIFAKRADDTETKLDDQLVPLVRKSVKAVTVVVGVIFVLQNMEVDVASLVAGASLGGLAFSLAARDTVANLFGSVSIFADQPFQVGDWVVMNGVEGVVEEVGMRSTRVRTFYRSLVSIPNSKVADGVIDNYGMRDSRRTFLKLGLQYDTTPEQMEAFCDGVRAILANNPLVKKDGYYVCFSGFGDSALEVMLYFFFATDVWAEELRNRHLIFLEVLRLAKELGVGFAFPTRTLHIASQAAPEATEAPAVKDLEAMGALVTGFGPGGALARPEGPHVSHGFWPGSSLLRGDDPDADIADSRDADG